MEDAHVHICKLLCQDGISMDAVQTALLYAEQSSTAAMRDCSAARSILARELGVNVPLVRSKQQNKKEERLSWQNAENLRHKLSEMSAELEQCISDAPALLQEDDNKMYRECLPAATCGSNSKMEDADGDAAHSPQENNGECDIDIENMFRVLRSSGTRPNSANGPSGETARARLEKLAAGK